MIIYEGNDEIIVTTAEKEADCIREWFTEGGRNIDEYDRRPFEYLPGVRVSFVSCIN